MSDTVSTETVPVTPVVPEIKDEKELPADILRKLLKEANDEAAATRVKKNEAVEAAKTEVTTEFEAKLTESNTAHEATKVKLATSSHEYDKLVTAIEAGVPTDKVTAFASALQGSTPEELKAHAETLKTLFGVTASKNSAVDPTAGAGNTALPLNGDPLLRALTNIVNK